MDSVIAALARRVPSEIRFDATVTGSPQFFYGRRSHTVHEAFEVRSNDGARLQVVDNLSLAPRIPVAVGDRVVVQGELVPYGACGPLVHWTHHDPRGRHPAGFIEWNGRRYA